MLDQQVARFFRALDAERLLDRLQIVAVRLLGCQTAVTDAGQRTLRMLSQTLRLPVFGTLRPLLKSHSNAAGFNPAFSHILIEASALPDSDHPGRDAHAFPPDSYRCPRQDSNLRPTAPEAVALSPELRALGNSV